ncbi:MAG: Ig-like domain-containing protein [Chloroflexota bacterium]|nr:Ig-like domain-containing protein [Chloroflexota bacterium]
MLPRPRASRAFAAATLWLLLTSLLAAPTLASPALLAAPIGGFAATLAFAADVNRLVPADGVATTTIVASVSDAGGRPLAGRLVELRPLGGGDGAVVDAPRELTAADGTARFTVRGQHAGRVAFGLFNGADWSRPGTPAATLDVHFTRKVVLLAPGFGSALARRFEIFGTPAQCADPAAPGSIYGALVCLGYGADGGLDGTVAGATVVDMSWTATNCRPTDASADCVATISRTADGADVHWRPADYDLGSFPRSLIRQAEVDRWAERLARTIATYDAELYATTGAHASFYLLGHSLGGEAVVRVLRVLAGHPELGPAFSDDGRGLLQAVVSVNGALNWTGGVAFFSDGLHCGFPVYTVADPARQADNAFAVEYAHAAFGTTTLAVTSAFDPIVGPQVALLNAPVPGRGYVEAVFHAGGAPSDCAHSTLLWPEPASALRYPLHELLVEHIGRAVGAGSPTAHAGSRPRSSRPSPLARL